MVAQSPYDIIYIYVLVVSQSHADNHMHGYHGKLLTESVIRMGQ